MKHVVLITGSDGQLGNELKDISNGFPEIDFVFTDIEQLNITDNNETGKFIREVAPEWIVNCAGYTAVDKAESESDIAMLLNSEAVNTLTSNLSQTGGKLIHISSDFVFDGKLNRPYSEEDSPSPLSVYGKSKLAGDLIALSYSKSLVIRTSWLYSQYGHNFVNTIIRLASQKDSIGVVNDQTGTPTYAKDLAQVIINIISGTGRNNNYFKAGLFNFSNEGQCSWYEFATEICNELGLPLEVNPINSVDYPLPAKRPNFSVLDKRKIKSEYNINIPDWKSSLAECLTKVKSLNNEG
jgi:dTDP-4-dehydrorhamnose reductase